VRKFGDNYPQYNAIYSCHAEHFLCEQSLIVGRLPQLSGQNGVSLEQMAKHNRSSDG
jgi:hypothetical protein